mmetsp:Transcript_7257/g.8318  ORF Transcript_7257/g.8318 Transcript_7257/m.8318 type:complete len:81 (-) Transcript_7257:255-497(-)
MFIRRTLSEVLAKQLWLLPLTGNFKQINDYYVCDLKVRSNKDSFCSFLVFTSTHAFKKSFHLYVFKSVVLGHLSLYLLLG